ncbi:gamma-glutamyl-gamma-aminobutyrate hydrolase family protein [Pseudoxanthomonas winnipegensis]|jgi:putative glutamine amidotransferase|uniref:gamma-glutamyl-gamma-aminobutyrate hydrolase family protein n=1 Tax=Pseudoxanthomonas winnipegensis TaxID=2480810 RepID=UPI00102DBBA4|nr:gamma-glutamyl-gamma-aminobutyrate hydrolase family protein [Pseudoxanthomonas winnipegensis]TAA07937.1 gamma-glutamyl-gamma-aminobutyrate hydrolase family protein [Pseudoxanthomonas winnipegensis]TAH72398.1 gamma-glutamyl-gamma-aminobutyrate hydrolase family protein [Pseudoxanthomonas winnipegensis]
MARPPLVGVPTDRRPIGSHPFLMVGEKYLRAIVEGAGCVPLLWPSLTPALPVEVLLDTVDGLLLTGAVSNIEPHHYSDEPSWEGNPHDAARDGTTLPLVRAALAAGVPILAICRGFQEVNVALGGTLHQKVHAVPGLMDHREDTSAPLEMQYGPAHPVTLAPGGLLASFGKAAPWVNSLHGQGVRRLAKGLVIEATAPDGLIEAFRHEGASFLLGVQWHPEWRVTEQPFYAGIFHAFGQACRARAARRHEVAFA